MSAARPPQQFLAFSRSKDRDPRHPVQLEVAVEYDLAGSIDERNSWVEPGSNPTRLEEAREECVKAAAKGIAEFWRFVIQGPINRRGAMKSVSQRLIALTHLIAPELLRGPAPGSAPNSRAPGPPLKLRELAALPQVNTTARELRKFQRAYLRAFGFRVWVQPIRRK